MGAICPRERYKQHDDRAFKQINLTPRILKFDTNISKACNSCAYNGLLENKKQVIVSPLPVDHFIDIPYYCPYASSDDNFFPLHYYFDQDWYWLKYYARISYCYDYFFCKPTKNRLILAVLAVSVLLGHTITTIIATNTGEDFDSFIRLSWYCDIWYRRRCFNITSRLRRKNLLCGLM